ncbi:MAG: hypothetical protein WC794_05460 [Candidatus Doudnabacteria bacterium]|jgi:hypothetical protein
MTKFSSELIERLQKFFADKYGVEVSDEQAEMYLDSLGKLWEVILRKKG